MEDLASAIVGRFVQPSNRVPQELVELFEEAARQMRRQPRRDEYR